MVSSKVLKFGSRVAEISATRGAEVGRGHCEVMEGQDLWKRAGVAIWRR